MHFEEIKQTADRYLMPTYAHFPVALAEGHNATYLDSEGKEYIDFTAGIGVNVFGVNDEGWKNAVKAQLDKVQHTSNLYYPEPVAKAAKLLCEKSGFDRVLFCNSGAEANECAIKLARKYSFDRYGEGRYKIVSLVNSFHGRTIATITATGQEHYHEFFTPFLEGFAYADAGDTQELDKMLDKSVCAVIMEIIQGEGGVFPATDEFIQGIRKKGIGGGLPMGACLCTEKCGETLTPGTHGTTFGGNPVACASAVEILNRIDDAFLQSVREKGDYIREKVSKFQGVKAVRGKGLMIGIHLTEKQAGAVATRCCEAGLLILTAKSALRMLPPLTITYPEIDKGLSVLEKVLAE